MSTRRKSELREATPFTQLTFLLHLVTSINLNQNGISTLKRESNARTSDQTLFFTFLDSVAAILVQEHEVVAACHISNDVSVIAVNDPPPQD